MRTTNVFNKLSYSNAELSKTYDNKSMLLLALVQNPKAETNLIFRLIENTPDNREHIVKLSDLWSKYNEAYAKFKKSEEAGHKPATIAKHKSKADAIVSSIKEMNKSVPDGNVYTDNRFNIFGNVKDFASMSEDQRNKFLFRRYSDIITHLSRFAGDSEIDFKSEYDVLREKYLESYNLTYGFIAETAIKASRKLRAYTEPANLDVSTEHGKQRYFAYVTSDLASSKRKRSSIAKKGFISGRTVSLNK